MPRSYSATTNGIAALACLGLILAVGACSAATDEDPPAAEPAGEVADAEEDAPLADSGTDAASFDLLELEDIDGGRINARFVFDGQPSAGEIEAAVPLIIEMLRDEAPYSGATAFLYDRPEYAFNVFTLGRVEDAPGGVWADAFGAPVGDYDEHELDVVIYERDWSQQPTAAEAERYLAYDTAYFALEEDAGADVDFDTLEQDAIQQAADQLGVSVEEIQAAIDAVSFWQFSGTQ